MSHSVRSIGTGCKGRDCRSKPCRSQNAYLDSEAAAELDELLLHPAADGTGLVARDALHLRRPQLRHARLIRHHPQLQQDNYNFQGVKFS